MKWAFTLDHYADNIYQSHIDFLQVSKNKILQYIMYNMYILITMFIFIYMLNLIYQKIIYKWQYHLFSMNNKMWN